MNTQLIFAISIFRLFPSKVTHFSSQANSASQGLSYDYFHTQKVKQNEEYEIQKKLIILNKNNKNLNIFIRHLFMLDELEQMKQEIRQTEINNLITRMKVSGYFISVSIKSEIVNKQQNIIIDYQSMPSLKLVKIKNNQNIIVPQKLIQRVFKNQINRPQNFKLINKSLKSIYKWYYEKGYQWINIKVLQEDSEAIELEIAEGIIDSIQFKFINDKTESNQTNNVFLLERIRDFFKIEEGYRLNYHSIEAKLSELKQKHIFENCDYTVLQSKTNTGKLDLLISIYEIPEKTTFLLGQNTNCRPGIVEAIESKIFNSINTLFKEVISVSKLINQQLTGENTVRENIQSLSRMPLYNYNSQKIVNKILTRKQRAFSSNLYEWYANPIHFINRNNLVINYNIQNLGRQKEYLRISFKIPSVYKNFIFSYCKPWITFYKQQTGLIQIQLLQRSSHSNHKKIADVLAQMFNHKLIFLDSLSTTRTLKAKLKIQLGNDWGLNKILRLESLEQNKTSIKQRSEFVYAKSVKNLKYQGVNKHIFLYNNSQLINSTYSNFTSLDTKLKYKFSYDHDIEWSKTGSNFILLSKYSTPCYSSTKNGLLNHYKKFSQRTIIKYIMYKNSEFKQKKRIFKRYFTFCDLELGNLIGSSTFFPWFEKFELKFPDYVIRNKERTHNFPKLLCRTRCEYHLGTPSNHSIFLFLNCLYSNSRHLFYKNKDILNELEKLLDTKHNSYTLSAGIGYQLKTSINRLPPVRIEFSISPDTEAIVYFRIIEVLASIAVHKKS